MSTNTPANEAITLTKLRTSIEDLQAHVIQMEALAHAATQMLEDLPFVPRTGGAGWTEDQRFNFGRLYTLVFSTADSAKKLLRQIDKIVDGLNNDDSDPGGAAPIADSGAAPMGDSGTAGSDVPRGRGPSGSDNSLAHGGSLLS